MSGIYAGAIWRPVPNFGYSPPGTHGQLLANGPRGAFWHDAQGWMEGAFSTFCDPKRGSAHFIFPLYEGKPFQFVDCDDAAWHCGGYIPGTGAFANLFYWGFEFEGGFPTPTPITDYQIEEAVKCCRWLSEHYGFTWQAERRVDLWEHGEVYNTNCPNGRIRWPEVIAALKEGQMDWPGAKIDLLNDFLEWWHEFPESQKEKDDPIRQARENKAYSRFWKAQISWRGPGQ